MKNFWLLLVLIVASCAPEKEQAIESELPTQIPASFNAYWSKGGAEITSYDLEQARYGEIHKGTAVTVFVTEPFSKSKQVKLDDYKSAGDDRVNVLKLNLTKKFLTGIYPYSMMLSTFSPLDGSPMIKSSMTVQEWCGHTFLQLNKLDTGYQHTGFSYFESEGDKTGFTTTDLAEDQLWTQIRLNPKELPLGETELFPSSFYLRLKHRPLESQIALATLERIESSDYSTHSHLNYMLKYKDRTLSIFFEENLPHRILGWEETHMSGFGNPELLTTKAKLKKTIRSKYWGKNSNSDRAIREELGLSTE